MSSSNPSSVIKPGGGVRLTWSLTTAARPRGLALAREKGWLLAWDEGHSLYLLDRQGSLQAQNRTPVPLSAACCADDGLSCAAVGTHGEIWWLAPDLAPRRQRALPHPAVAVALDPFGQYLAASDVRGNLHVFDRRGRPVCQGQAPRPLHHLAFVPEVPFLIGCADFGLVACFNLAGECVWRDGLVAHVGSLAVGHDGGRIVLACYSEGLRGYALDGQKLGRLPAAEPCGLAALTFDGRYTLAVSLAPRLLLLNADWQILWTHALDALPGALALAALGERAVLALGDRRVVGLELRDSRR